MYPLDANGEALTCLRSFVDLLEIFIAAPNPFDLPYSALFEPVLRLMVSCAEHPNI